MYPQEEVEEEQHKTTSRVVSGHSLFLYMLDLLFPQLMLLGYFVYA